MFMSSIPRNSRILISGASGLIGSSLRTHLKLQGYDVFSLVRKSAKQKLHYIKSTHDITWDPEAGHIDLEKLEGFDAIIHLSGENIASLRWTKKKKEKIRSSRLKGLELLLRVCKILKYPPKRLLVASAVGYYGDKGDETVTDTSSKGSGFLADLTSDIEGLCKASPIKAIPMRFGIILSEKGGLLKKMIPLFRVGLGAVLGPGDQFMSWIHLDDAVRLITHCLENSKITSAVNITAEPTTQSDFASALAKTLKKPLFLKIPKFLIRWLGGEMADSLVLNSVRAYPSKMLEPFIEHPTIEEALESLLYFDEASIMKTPYTG